jgi:hypothetical protein
MIGCLYDRKVEVLGQALKVDIRMYATNGRPAIVLVDENDSVFGTLTTNVEYVDLVIDEEIIVKDWSENEMLAKAMFETGWFEDTERRVKTGFVLAPVWRVVK